MAETDRIEVLTAAKLWPPMMESLRGASRCTTAPTRATLPPSPPPRRESGAIAASGESKVPRELIAQLPSARDRLGVRRRLRRRRRHRGARARHRRHAHAERPQRRGRRPGHGARARRLAPPHRSRPLRAQRRLGERADAARAQGERRAHGHRRPRPHRHGDREARRGIRHVDRLHLAQRATRSALPLLRQCRGARRARSTSWSSSPRAAPRRESSSTPRCWRRSARRATSSTSRAARSSTSRRWSSALRDGTIAGAGLDVFESEPNVPSELLRPRQRRPHAARGQRDLADAPGDGRPGVRQPRRRTSPASRCSRRCHERARRLRSVGPAGARHGRRIGPRPGDRARPRDGGRARRPQRPNARQARRGSDAAARRGPCGRGGAASDVADPGAVRSGVAAVQASVRARRHPRQQRPASSTARRSSTSATKTGAA